MMACERLQRIHPAMQQIRIGGNLYVCSVEEDPTYGTS